MINGQLFLRASPTLHSRASENKALRRGIACSVILPKQVARRRGFGKDRQDARRSEADVIEQHDKNVRRALRRSYGLDGGKFRIRVFRVIRDKTGVRLVRDRQYFTREAL
jgi:hypothetical protein